MNKLEMMRKRAALIKEARAILDKSADESRALMDKEEDRFSKLMAEVDGLAQQIGGLGTFQGGGDRSVSLSALEEDLNRSMNEPHKPDPGGGYSYGPNEVRALLPNERMVDVVEGGQEPLSLGRVMRGILLGDWKGAEAEVRAMGEGVGALGGYLVPDSLSAMIIDMARAQTVCIQAGARTIPMDTAEMTIGKISADPTGYWRAEHAAITESDMGFEPINLKAQALGCLVRVSLELLEDAAMFSQTLEGAISKALALELDRAALLGAGTTEPLGISNTTGVNEISMGTNGLTPTDYSKYSSAVEVIATNNGAAGAVIYSPRTAGTLDRFTDGDGQPLKPPESYQNLRKYVTSKIPNTQTQGSATNCSSAIVGDYKQLLFGIRTQITLEATRVAGTDTFAKMQALVRGYLRADVAVLRPNHFTKIIGIKP